MRVGILMLHLRLPGCRSLKEKRRRVKPLLNRLHKEFNLSVAEVDAQDVWQTAVIACVTVSNDGGYAQHMLQKVVQWVEVHWPDVQIAEEHVTLC
ncbi:MAG TPA: DUF503 domain-containing protein [Anaerolineae bacterium]|nr:DUF503 domain-containing protein [Anaerolineae bacterium]HID84913.1 DUF503 domain-containing protein [Anaerolineales bacterium]HIQ08832.1 DUF503 domain-containing protein [Anaerolineaceae bacterium]